MAGINYFSSANILSLANREKCLQIFRAVPSLKPIPTEKKAAVLVPLCVAGGEMSLLFTLRSMNLSSHKGHVSFPGGKFDLTDQDLIATALRETEEELGISKSAVDVWGAVNSYPSKNFDMAVTPVIGYIHNFDSLKLQINPDEVQEAFTVSLENLSNPQNIAITKFKNGWTLPEYTGGPHKIWGLTATITHLFLSCLLPKEAYPMQFKYLNIPDHIELNKPKL